MKTTVDFFHACWLYSRPSLIHFKMDILRVVVMCNPELPCFGPRLDGYPRV
jgi:hypothetical protein